MIADLRALWQEAFAESDAFTDLFFTKGFSPDRHHRIEEDGLPVSALYWFDCSVRGRRFAYIYAVATLKSHRGKGLAGRLLTQTHEILRRRGYDGVILVPAGKDLFSFYRKFGYETATTVTKFSCDQGDSPVAIREISPEEYARLCPGFLPQDAVVHGADALVFLQGYCKFYAGEDFLLVCQRENGELRAQEFLGNTDAAPGILQALNIPTGTFRTPGADRDFAMFFPLTADCPKPGWFSLALD